MFTFSPAAAVTTMGAVLSNGAGKDAFDNPRFVGTRRGYATQAQWIEDGPSMRSGTRSRSNGVKGTGR